MKPSTIADAMMVIDEAQEVILGSLFPTGDPPAPEEPAAPVKAPDEVEPVEAPAEPPDEVEVEFLRPITICVQGNYKSFAVGKTTITAGMRATIKQTHEADALRG